MIPSILRNDVQSVQPLYIDAMLNWERLAVAMTALLLLASWTC